MKFIVRLAFVSIVLLLLSIGLVAQTKDAAKISVVADTIFQKIEIAPSFPGGEQAWRKFLDKNIRSKVPLKNDAPEGSYTVYVKFIVDPDGSLTDFKAVTSQGYGMEEEVVRILKKSPRWSPGMQNGRVVRAYKTQAVTFTVGKD